ncbi:MAG: TIGR02221 family CRISPR-associated protein [Leptotrichiaceae bacterium]|nr:TIGR02221 family CRISPR-associated protein [Leptotrichiaceae bacterium]
MAKILICGLGGGKRNGEYPEANYSIQDGDNIKIYRDRKFIASALEEHYAIDKTIYIGTAGSMWDSLYLYYSEKFKIEKNEDYYFKLAEEIEKANRSTDLNSIDLSEFKNKFGDKIEIKITNYGLSNIEIFENFNIIMELEKILNDGDELYIDITHSFRSNALWMYLVMNYITDVIDKKIAVKMISYGMFELKEDEISPIIDLTAFYELNKWIKGASGLINYGNSYQLLELIEDKDIKNKFKAFSDALNLNYIGTIKQNLKSIKKIMDKLENLEGPAKLILPNVAKNFIKNFDNIEEGNDDIMLVRMAKWHFGHKRYAMAYININEAIRMHFKIVLELKDMGEENELLKKIGYRKEGLEYKSSKEGQKLREIHNIFEHSRRVRNEIAHSIGEKESAINDSTSLESYCDKLENLLSDKKFLIRALQKFDLI